MGPGLQRSANILMTSPHSEGLKLGKQPSLHRMTIGYYA